MRRCFPPFVQASKPLPSGMASGSMAALADRFGKDNITDVLAGTGVEQQAENLGFGLFIIRRAVEPADIKQFEEGMKTMFEEASGDGPKESSSRKACKTGREHHDLRNNQLTKFQ